MDLEVHILNIPVIVPSVTSFQINYIKHIAQHSTKYKQGESKSEECLKGLMGFLLSVSIAFI